MKVAVITNSHKALSFLNYLVSLEAEVILFSEIHFSLDSIKQIPHKIQWIQKKSLSLEDLSSHERMKDEFRIVYEYLPEADLALSENNQEMIESLRKPLDFYVDVDGVVILTDENLIPCFSHPSGAPAMGEIKISKSEQLHYELPAEKIILPPQGELAVVGHSLKGRDGLKKILHWLSEDTSNARRVFWVTPQSSPWIDIEDAEILKLKEMIYSKFELKVSEFVQAHHKWLELDDFVKVKIPKPQEPIPQLVIFAAHHVSSFDTHINSSLLYVTLERNYFVQPTVQEENGHKDLKTIGVNQVYVFNGYQNPKTSAYPSYLRSREVGVLNYSFAHFSLNDIKNDFDKNFVSFFKRE
jgi:hypothetical protein